MAEPGEQSGFLMCKSYLLIRVQVLMGTMLCYGNWFLVCPLGPSRGCAPVSQDERDLEAKMARVLQGVISQGISLKGQETGGRQEHLGQTVWEEGFALILGGSEERDGRAG